MLSRFDLVDVCGDVTVTVRAVECDFCNFVEFTFDCFVSEELGCSDKFVLLFGAAFRLALLRKLTNVAIISAVRKNIKKGGEKKMNDTG